MQNIPEVPLNLSWELKAFLEGLRNAIIANVQTSVIPPRPVVNLSVTPGPGLNFIQFTRSDGDAYALYVNDTSELNGATRFDLGLANTFTHTIGIDAVKRFYWIKTKLGQLESVPVGPVSATTLALNVAITLPPEVAPSETPTRSNQDDAVVPGRPSGSYFNEDL